MNPEIEKQINLNLIITGYKLNALKKVLTEEQRKIYDESINESIQKIKKELSGKLSEKELEDVCESLII